MNKLTDRLEVFAHFLYSVRGWRRRASLFGLGVLLAASMPPIYALPLMVVAFSGMLWAMQGRTIRQRFFDGWWFGWGFYIAGTYWIAISLLTDVGKFGWLIPFTVLGLTGALAIFAAFACMLTALLRPTPYAQWLGLAGFWALVDYSRGHILTGFPWNLPASALAFSDTLLQPLSILGAYGYSWVVVLIAASGFLVVQAEGFARRGVFAMLGMWALLGVMFAGGHLRLAGALNPDEAGYFVPDVKLRLVQANISQPHKWNPALQMRGLQEHIQLSLLSEGLDDITHVIWPETAIPYVLADDSKLLGLVATVAPASGGLITGALRTIGEGDDWEIFNSLVAIGQDGKIHGSYDKHHLVPFGEFVPLRWLLPIEKITPGLRDFSRGKGPATLTINGAPPFSPLICYEAIFPDEVVAPGSPRPQWMLNITNDAWFGQSSGPYQHFVATRMRAVEQGMPLVRVANTGISGVVDAYGRVIAMLPLSVKTYLDSRLPVALPQTSYGQIGDWPTLLLMIVTVLAGYCRKRSIQKPKINVDKAS